MELQRYEMGDYCSGYVPNDDGEVCMSYDVRKLEESHQRLLDALNFVLEHDMGDYKTADEFGGYVLDEDIRAFIQDAISKSIQ